MSKWLMLVVVVMLVLTAAVGLRNIAAQSWDGAITVSAPAWTMAPTGAPAPAIPWGK
jgi:hypothetical protein